MKIIGGDMKEQSNIIDITNLLEYKRQFELAECPYLAVEGAEYSADYHFVRPNKKVLPIRKPIPIFSGASEARKRRVMRAIERGKR